MNVSIRDPRQGTAFSSDEWLPCKGIPGQEKVCAFCEFREGELEGGVQHYQAYGPYSDSYILYRK